MASLTTEVIALPDSIARVLRCPRCAQPFVAGDPLRCVEGHAFEVRNGLPRLVVETRADEKVKDLTLATRQAFGDQWVRSGDQARVTLADLYLHLPTGTDKSIFSGLVLDAGCGMGRYTTLAATLGATAVGIDLSHAVDKAAATWPNATFIQADISCAPFAPNSFDLVYSFGVLHHLPYPLAGFRACFDLVRPGGMLLAWVYSAHGGVLRSTRRRCRGVVARVPSLHEPLAWAAALALWGLIVVPGRVAGRRGGRLGFYRDKGLRQVYVDCHDALIAPKESYLSAEDCEKWIASVPTQSGGFEQRRDGSGWLIWVRKS